MASVNKVLLIGNLGRDPEMRYSASGDALCNFSIATTDSWKDKATGEKKENTEWHRITCFGKLAEICGQYLKKGAQVYVEGSLRTLKWTDKEGRDQYTTEVRCDTMKMLGSTNGQGGQEKLSQGSGNASGGQTNGRGEPSYAPNPERKKPSFDDLGDDLPF